MSNMGSIHRDRGSIQSEWYQRQFLGGSGGYCVSIKQNYHISIFQNIGVAASGPHLKCS